MPLLLQFATSKNYSLDVHLNISLLHNQEHCPNFNVALHGFAEPRWGSPCTKAPLGWRMQSPGQNLIKRLEFHYQDVDVVPQSPACRPAA